ncbi:MAG: hypothetical protein IKB79_03500 [Oscillospiraceae bacterium]|nr:hypothetical protein [Oscillospiraceae bacterium]
MNKHTLWPQTAQTGSAAKRLLALEVWVITVSILMLLAFTFAASLISMADWLRIVLILLGFIAIIPGLIWSLKIEQIAGYYRCGNCHHKHVPTLKAVFCAAHMGRTRYMTCPKCGKKSWQKKVLT